MLQRVFPRMREATTGMLPNWTIVSECIQPKSIGAANFLQFYLFGTGSGSGRGFGGLSTGPYVPTKTGIGQARRISRVTELANKSRSG